MYHRGGKLVMKVTRNVILDLLPLYIAGEVSDDTRTIIEDYLKTDSELAGIAERLSKTELRGEIPIPLKKEKEMETIVLNL